MKKLLITFIVICSFLPVVGFASTGDNVSGWGYASNLGPDGWISFNCTNHGCWEPYGPGGGDEPEGPDGGIDGGGGEADDGAGAGGAFLFDRNSFPRLSILSTVGTFLKDILQPVIGRTALADTYPDGFFTGSNYGVSVDPTTGLMSGYAWNNKIGWISFNESVGCPEGDCSPTLDLGTGRLEGWARAVEHSGGWDGWISLSCTNASAYTFELSRQFIQTYLEFSATELVEDGRPYAWGGDVLGWVHLAEPGFEMKIELDQPIVTLTTSDIEFCPDDNSITLTWNAVGADLLCTASSIPLDTAFTGPIATSGTAVVTPTAPTTYSISCIAPGSDAAYQQTVSVALGECGDSDLILSAEPAPAQCTAGYRTDLFIYSPNSTTFMSCSPVTSIPAGPTYPITGAPNPGNGYMVVVPDVLAHTNPTVFQTTCYEPDATPLDMTDNPSMLVQTSVARACAAPRCDFTSASVGGEPLKASLTWTSSGGTGTGLTASGGWSGTKAFSGSQSGIAFTSPETTYTLTVTNPDGVTDVCSATLNKTNVDDPICDPDPNDPNGEECDVVASVELTADPTSLGEGGGSTVLEWSSSNIDSDTCVGYSWPTTAGWNGAKADDGMQSVSIITGTTFRVQCVDAYTDDIVTDDATVTVDGTPPPPPPPPECTDVASCRTKPWYYER
jgi:hypothetical protein